MLESKVRPPLIRSDGSQLGNRDVIDSEVNAGCFFFQSFPNFVANSMCKKRRKVAKDILHSSKYERRKSTLITEVLTILFENSRIIFLNWTSEYRNGNIDLHQQAKEKRMVVEVVSSSCCLVQTSKMGGRRCQGNLRCIRSDTIGIQTNNNAA
ncbi:hypothetical protein ACFE04_016338 [Oxalis oulophora]